MAAFWALLCLATSGCGTGSAAPVEPSAADALAAVPQVVALVNASAPDDDLLGSYFCAGVLIGSRRVLTAGHCISPGHSDLDVVIGADNLCSTAPIHGQRIRVRAVRTVTGRDLAVLRLAHRAAVRPLPVLAMGATRRSRVAVGWGRVDLVDPSACTRRAVVLEPGPSRSCAAARPGSPFAGADTAWCAVPAAGQRRNTCVGDSGGPVLAMAVPGRAPGVVAITSWGAGCAIDDVGFYVPATGLPPW